MKIASQSEEQQQLKLNIEYQVSGILAIKCTVASATVDKLHLREEIIRINLIAWSLRNSHRLRLPVPLDGRSPSSVRNGANLLCRQRMHRQSRGLTGWLSHPGDRLFLVQRPERDRQRWLGEHGG
jgi:hypothetical protein